MKKIFLSFAVFTASLSVNAQYSFNLKEADIEFSIGSHLILAPTPVKVPTLNNVSKYRLGFSVPLDYDNELGIRSLFEYGRFQSNSSQSSFSTKLIGELTYNWIPGYLLNCNTDKEYNFHVLGHFGLGVGVTKSRLLNYSSWDKIGIIQLGVTPKYKLNKSVFIFTDLTFAVNLSQDYRFSGLSSENGRLGQIIIPSIGFTIKPFY